MIEVVTYLVPVSRILHVVELSGICADLFTQVVGDKELVEEHDDEHDTQDQHDALEHVPPILQINENLHDVSTTAFTTQNRFIPHGKVSS